MARFQVLRRVDAFVDYVAEIEADSADEAAAKADQNEERYHWAKRGIAQFDSRLFVTLDDSGIEIDSTQRGDF
jgi:hypothetical protein